jgi:hypothetical protein
MDYSSQPSAFSKKLLRTFPPQSEPRRRRNPVTKSIEKLTAESEGEAGAG